MYNKKTIAFVIPTMNSGGMERVMSEIVTYVSKISEVECHLIIYGKSSAEDFYRIPSQVYIYRPNFKFNDSRRLYSTFKTSYFLRSTIKRIKPDTLLSFGEYWNNFVLLSLIGLKIPVYVSDRCSPQVSLGIIQDFLRKNLYPTAAGVVMQTRKAQEIFEANFLNKKIKVIGNPIRTINARESTIRENIIVSVGRLITTKNFNRLIDIFAKINKPDWRLIIVGGDSDKQNNSIVLADKIKELKMKDRIQLVGIQRDIDSFLLKSAIFAFTSSSEGFPNVIGEAMSAGLPVIAYDCIAGPSDMIEDGRNGFLIPLFDDNKFENKLRFLMRHKEERERMGIYARESVRKYSVESICSQYYNFLLSK